MNKKLVSILLFCAFALGYWVGLLSHNHLPWPVERLSRIKKQLLREAVYDADYRLIGYPDKKKIPCPEQTAQTVVLFTIGQSNTANSAEQRHASTAGDKVVNYFEGDCFVASSPLLGTTDQAGEPWTLLGNRLVQNHMADRVILIPAGIGGSPIKRWQEGGDLNKKMLSILDRVKPVYRVTHILWHQGETDFALNTPKVEYEKMFRSLVDSIRKRGIPAPVYVSVASRTSPAWSPDNPVALAQKSLVDRSRNILPGVDTDSLLASAESRHDGVHFSASGQEKFANAWMEVLKTAP
ncbi:MAG: hypothetical protein HQL64_08075 [Magnetococcales bacterium]|nr:hypothetical protein [Magnetococcales bacterium]